MSLRYQGGFISAFYNPLKVPNAPTIGAATAGNAQCSVAFTAPSDIGGGEISSYIVVVTDSSSGAVFTNTGASSPIVVTGLTNGNTYTAKVAAANTYGPSSYSENSSSFIPVLTGQQAYTTAGTYSWVAPAGVDSVSVVAVGGGGGAGDQNGSGTQASGGGGGLGYKNNITVVPGNSYTVVVGAYGQIGSPGTAGGTSSFINTSTVSGGGGGGGRQNNPGVGGTYTGDGGGNGGAGALSLNGWGGSNYGIVNGYHSGAGGGGAGGYSGSGGSGGNAASSAGASGGQNGSAGSGGGGGGGAGGGGQWGSGGAGGGVGLLGEGTSGAGGTLGNYRGGKGGSGGGDASGSSSSDGSDAGLYGGGSGGAPYPFGSASGGAVRIIWPGGTRSFPSTNTGDL